MKVDHAHSFSGGKPWIFVDFPHLWWFTHVYPTVYIYRNKVKLHGLLLSSIMTGSLWWPLYFLIHGGYGYLVQLFTITGRICHLIWSIHMHVEYYTTLRPYTILSKTTKFMVSRPNKHWFSQTQPEFLGLVVLNHAGLCHTQNS